MFAVIKTGGKQYKVTEGAKFLVEKIDKPVGEEFDFEEVLLLGNAVPENVHPVKSPMKSSPKEFHSGTPKGLFDGVKIGTPFVAGAKVRVRILDHGKAEKKIIFKFKNKTRYWKKKGHHQPFTQIEILKITPM